MFLFTFLYFALNILKMYQNAFYEITPPSPYEITPPPPTVEDRNTTVPSWEYVQEARMQAAIERFASYDEYMDIPLPSRHPLAPLAPLLPSEEEEVEDDETICYDDEVYRFDKCGEIDGCYDYSEFYETETVVPEHEDYSLYPGENGVPMDFETQQQYDFDDYEEDYHNDPDYWEEMRIERMIDRFQNFRLD